MKLKMTQHLSIEDADNEVVKIIHRIKVYHPQPLPPHIERRDYDWFFVSIEVTRREDPVDGTLYLIQHFGKVGDSGYMAYVLEDVFRNRKDLDVLIQFLENQPQQTDFMRSCVQIVRGLRLGTSLIELTKKGILTTPPPQLN